MSVNLDLGCGYVDHPDFIAVDKLNYGHNIIADVLEGLPFPDDYFDFVLMNHTLQMFKYDELPIVLKEVRRVMKKNGILRILVPDLDRAITAYQKGDASYFPISDELEPDLSGKLARYMFWHGDTHCMFNWQSLISLLERNGFDSMYVDTFGNCELDSREKESLVVVCEK
jgi:SAM-dependent methyltransferase